MSDSGNDPHWHWDGQRWLWWNGSSWQQVAQEAGDQPQVAITAQASTVPASPPSRGLTRGGVIAIALGAVIAIALLGGAAAVVLTRMSGGNSDGAAVLQTEPTSWAANAFTPPVGTDAAVTPAPATGVQIVSAGTPGLYGGTQAAASCNKDQLVAYLAQNPDKAATWAGVLGIGTNQIAEYVAPLTPVILRSDTAVTNHGFEGGKAAAVPAVLQAGTAVLVNAYGQPVIKCYCGNPLTPPPGSLNAVRYSGSTWTTFVPGSYLVIQPTVQVITTFTLTDIVSGQTFDRPAGTSGASDDEGAGGAG